MSERSGRPPFLIGERVFWLGSGSGLPKSGYVKWIGRLAEMGPELAVGIELDDPLPYGGIDGTWNKRHLFTCKAKHGLIVPCSNVISQPKSKVESASSSRSQNLIPLLSQHKTSNKYKQGFKPGPPPRNRNKERKGINISTLPRSSECFGEEQTKIDAFSIRESYLHSLYLNRQHHAFVSRRMIHERNFRTSDDTLNTRISSKRSSGIFSFFKWFKRDKQEDFDFDSVSLRGSRFGTSLTSIDTIFSTATANSFSFIPPLHYRPFGGAAQPEFCIDVGPETNTYKNRIKQRDRLRQIDQNVSLKEKYRLYASETLSRSADKLNENCSINKKKRKAPPPPLTQSDVSLPASLENKQKVFKHRRAVSEPVKYAKALHVKGKRKAPRPPDTAHTLSLTRKQRAPPPPVSKTKPTDDELETISNASTVKADSDIVYTDTLKLEKGILKPNMDRPSCTKFTPTSPVSPRPWYKRTTPHKDGIWKLNDKKKEKRKSDEWMFESGVPRRNVSIDKFNLFTKIDKPEEKRKSQISILTNISELDREAAEIVRKGRIYEEIPEFQNLEQEEKPNSAKELISLFNDITNVSKVTVNNSFVIKDGVFTKEEKPVVKEVEPEPEPVIEEPEEEASGPIITRVTIEELDEFDAEKNTKDKQKSENFETASESTKSKELLARLVWVCSRCTLENSRWRITCEACDNWRPMPCDFVEKSKKDTEFPVLKIIEPFEEASNVKADEHLTENANLDSGLKKPLVDKILNVEPKASNKNVDCKNDPIADAEEVRKARLAFFKKNKLPEFKEETFAKDTQTTPSIDKPLLAQGLEENRQKLREMLKEIKHSLPKKKDEPKEETKNKENRDSKEAFLIESTTVVEEIKLKKPSDKISAAAQTSAMVRQISPKIKPPSGKEVVVPITVEDYKIKDGVLYTSITKDAKKIGTGTFELMRPKDFANVQAIKNNKVLPHLYANVNQEQIAEDYKHLEKLTNQLVKPQGLSCLNGIKVENGNNMNTLAVNRFLKRLEGAIANGQHELAAALAKELAQLKIICSVTRQKPEVENALTVEMFVEDQKNHQGPFPIKVTPLMTVAELKTVVETEYEIPVGVQRWILGKALANDDSATLESMGVTQKSPIFLYLVAPIKEENNIQGKEIQIEPKPGPSHRKDDIEQPSPLAKTEGWGCLKCTLINSLNRPGCLACGSERPKQYETNEPEIKEDSVQVVNEDKKWHYEKLIDLEKDDLITCVEAFDCPVCLVRYQAYDGVVLRECLHVFCRACLAQTIEYSDEAEVKCPFRDDIYTCDSTLLEREIKALVTPEIYEGHLAKSIALAETKIGNAFHCKTPDCKGWCIYEDMVNLFKCPVCTHTNCLTCQAIHEGLNCKQYQEQIKSDGDSNLDSKRTKEMLQEMVDRGEAMNCPTCQVVLMKKWGCDWLRCSMCKTEICWITRGPRWGPNGKGDTNGGCKCGINGIKCHPKCTYCH